MTITFSPCYRRNGNHKIMYNLSSISACYWQTPPNKACTWTCGILRHFQSLEFRRIVITDKGKGYGRESLRLIKKMAFEELSAHRLWLDVKDHNLRARHVYEAEGFMVEGVLRIMLTIWNLAIWAGGLADSSVLRWKLQNPHLHGGTYANPTS